MSPARTLTLLLAACSIMATGLVAREGWVERAYPDPVHGNRVPTGCAGVTKSVKVGQVFTREECVEKTAVAMIEHTAPIMRCVPETITPELLAVFGDFSYNVGASGFCGSTVSRRAMSGDLKGACDAILLWYKSGGLDCRTDRRCRGLWNDRQVKRGDCYAAIGLPRPAIQQGVLK